MIREPGDLPFHRGRPGGVPGFSPVPGARCASRFARRRNLAPARAREKGAKI
jgi:hypothetical protein